MNSGQRSRFWGFLSYFLALVLPLLHLLFRGFYYIGANLTERANALPEHDPERYEMADRAVGYFQIVQWNATKWVLLTTLTFIIVLGLLLLLNRIRLYTYLFCLIIYFIAPYPYLTVFNFLVAGEYSALSYARAKMMLYNPTVWKHLLIIISAKLCLILLSRLLQIVHKSR